MSRDSCLKVIEEYRQDGGEAGICDEASEYIEEGFDVTVKLTDGTDNPFQVLLSKSVELRKQENPQRVFKDDAERKSEEELMKLPTFEDYVDKGLRSRPDYHVITTNILYYGCLMNLNFNAECMRTIGKESNGMFTSDDDQFKDASRQWWYFYKKILLIRSFILHNWDVPAPNWKDLMPERYYTGTILSQEDFKAYMLKPKEGVNVLPAEKIPENI